MLPKDGFANDYAVPSAVVAFVCTWSMCNRLEGSYLDVGLQPGGTDGATSFTRWLKLHDSDLFSLLSKRKLAKQSATFPALVMETQLPRRKQAIIK